MIFRSITAAIIGLVAAVAGANAKISQITECTIPGTIAPTYDDGPSEYTSTLLSTLQQTKVTLTFFIVGNMVKDNPKVLQQMKDQGHQLALHTFSHPHLDKLKPADIINEVIKNSDEIFKAAGVRPRYLRCPYGECGQKVLDIFEKFGLQVISWSGDEGDTNDWQKVNANNAAHNLEVYKAAINNPKINIFLQHDIYSWSVEAAAKIIPFLQSNNRIVVPVDQCLANAPPRYFQETEWKAAVANVKGGQTPPTDPTTVKPVPTQNTNAPTPSGNGQCSVPLTDVNLSGGDIKSVKEKDASKCCDLCAATDNCDSFTWSNSDSGTCLLKNTRSGSITLTTTPGAISGLKLNALLVDLDFFGGDLGSTQAQDADACFNACSKASGCTSFTFTNYNGGTCWLKSSIASVKVSKGALSAVLGNGGSSPATIKPTSTPSSSVPGANFFGSTPQTGIDFYGGDLRSVSGVASAAGCAVHCGNNAQCELYSYSKGNCYLKASGGASTIKFRKTDGVSSAVIGRSNQNVVIENIDFFGKDLSNVKAPTPDACYAACRANTACKAYTWTQSKVCYLKSGVGTFKTANGVRSAFVA